MNILPRNPADREVKSPCDKNIRYPVYVPGHDSPNGTTFLTIVVYNKLGGFLIISLWMRAAPMYINQGVFQQYFRNDATSKVCSTLAANSRGIKRFWRQLKKPVLPPGVLPLAARRVFCRKHIKPVWYYAAIAASCRLVCYGLAVFAARVGGEKRVLPRELAASVLPA
jgi:hypothetical protein